MRHADTATCKPEGELPLAKVVRETERIRRRYHLTYLQAVDVGKHVRNRLKVERPAKRRTVFDRLSQDESKRFIAQAYRARGQRGLLVNTLLFSGARVSEFVAIRVDDFFLEEAMILIRKGKGRNERYVPILPDLAQELRTHLGHRKAGHLFETRAARGYSPRRVQQVVKAIATDAGITKRVYRHLLRHTVAPRLDEVQSLLGHEKLETTQIYAESSPRMIQDSYRRALGAGGAV